MTRERSLSVIIPAYCEAGNILGTLENVTGALAGLPIACEVLVIDDGSTDGTAEVARRHGVDHVVRHPHNRGLARSFMTGLDACLAHGADVIVNTDADNQYNADDIPLLTAPILAGTAEIVIGARPIRTIEHFSPAKKFLQRLGSRVVRMASKSDVPDAPSGFRAWSRQVAQWMMVFSDYTYTLETIIQAGQHNMAVVSVPIRVNGELRPSRLVKSIPSYIRRSIVTIIRIFVIYRPFRFFGTIGLVLLGAGFLLGLRFLYYYLTGDGGGHLQSVILAGALLIIGFQTILIAFVADLQAANRKLLEEIRFRARQNAADRDQS